MTGARYPFWLALGLALFAIALLAGCGGGSDEPVADDRKSIVPVVCKDAAGNVIPGNCV